MPFSHLYGDVTGCGCYLGSITPGEKLGNYAKRRVAVIDTTKKVSQDFFTIIVAGGFNETTLGRKTAAAPYFYHCYEWQIIEWDIILLVSSKINLGRSASKSDRYDLRMTLFYRGYFIIA